MIRNIPSWTDIACESVGTPVCGPLHPKRQKHERSVMQVCNFLFGTCSVRPFGTAVGSYT